MASASEVNASVEERGSRNLLRPCRPYRPGDHARWLRGRLTRSMLIAAVGGGVVSATLGIAIAYVTPGLAGLPATIVGWSAFLLFPLLFLAVHWATIGARRWAAVELVVWAGRASAARFGAATGLRDPTDKDRAASWVASHLHRDGEPAETTYWRAYLLLLLGDDAAARAELARISDDADWRRDRAMLAAEIDLAEGRPTDVAALDELVAAMAPSSERAAAAVEVGALRSHVAWTCGGDDVAPVLAALPDVEGRSAGTLLRHYWLPLAATTVVVWAALTLLLSLLG